MSFKDMPTIPKIPAILDMVKGNPNLIDGSNEAPRNIKSWIIGFSGAVIIGLTAGLTYYYKDLLMDWYQIGQNRINELLHNVNEDHE